MKFLQQPMELQTFWVWNIWVCMESEIKGWHATKVTWSHEKASTETAIRTKRRRRRRSYGNPLKTKESKLLKNNFFFCSLTFFLSFWLPCWAYSASQKMKRSPSLKKQKMKAKLLKCLSLHYFSLFFFNI